MNKIGVFNETKEDMKSFQKEIPKLFRLVFQKENIKNAECNVIFVDSKMIHDLNRTYRGVDRVTDVISFALEDEESRDIEVRLLGDIYICYEKAVEQAQEYGHSLRREILFLAVHGLYHLLGYDHRNQEEERVMFQKQEEVLEVYGVVR